MKINTKALFRAKGIRCRKMSGEDGTGFDARIAYVTGQTVEAARGMARRDPALKPGDGDPDLRYGAILAVHATPDGQAAGEIVDPGQAGDYVLQVGDRSMGLCGLDMLDLREAIVALHKSGQALSTDQARALEGVQEIFQMVASAPDPDRFPTPFIAQAYRAAMIDHFGLFESSVDPEQMTRKSRADLIRARIGMLDPGHADAITTARPLRETLSGAGIELSEAGVSRDLSMPGIDKLNEEAIRRAIQSDDSLVRDFFGAVTATPVDRISMATIPLSALKRMRDEGGRAPLSGNWVDTLSERFRRITGDSGSGFELAMFSEGGRDIIAMSVPDEKRRELAVVYSWPTADRIPVIDAGGMRHLSLSPEEVPSDDEVRRLSEMLGRIEDVANIDPDPEGDKSALGG